MRRKRSLILPMLMVALMLLSFVACNNNPGVSEGNGTLTVLVSEATSKLIGFNPDGGEPLAISHYGISLKDDDGTELKKTETPIALSGGSGSFTITGLVTGNYTIDATGYVKNGDDYTEVATGTSGEIFISPTTDTETTILIDTWKEGNAESVTISVVMPEDIIAADGTVAFDGNLKYSLTEIGTGTETIPEKSISLTTGQALSEGLYTLTIDDEVPPGRYILSVSFTSESAVKEYSNADAVLVYPGLPVTGTISIDSHSVFDEDFSVTNALGEPITVEGDGIYSTENGTFTVTLSNTLTATQKIVWYADGVALKENEGYTVAGNVYTFTGVSAGEHYFVGIVHEEGKEASIGSIQLTISVAEPEIEFPSHFTYTDNGDGTCTITGENPDNPLPSHDGLVIPDEINGLKVTIIGSNAFGNITDNHFTGSLIISDNVIDIEYAAFKNCGFTGTLILGDNIVNIGNAAFSGNDFIGDLHIPDNVKTIGWDAFSYNEFSGNLILGKSVQTIGFCAFYGNSLTGDLIIPDSVIEINQQAFCANSFDGVLKIGTGIQYIPNSMVSSNNFTGDLIIPDNVTEISTRAFYNCGFTGSLVLGENLQVIGDSVFELNEFSGDLIIPDNVTEIGQRAFFNIGFNGNLKLGENVEIIEYDAFAYNAFNGELVIPSSILTMGRDVFAENSFSSIKCEAIEQPLGWDAEWNNGCNAEVTWGYTGV